MSDKFTGPGKLYMEILTEANIYTIGEEEVPNLVTSKNYTNTLFFYTMRF